MSAVVDFVMKKTDYNMRSLKLTNKYTVFEFEKKINASNEPYKFQTSSITLTVLWWWE